MPPRTSSARQSRGPQQLRLAGNATRQTLSKAGRLGLRRREEPGRGHAISEAKTALSGTDIEAIKAATEKLQQAGYKLAEVVYSSQQGAAGADAQPSRARGAGRRRQRRPSRPTTRSSMTTRKASNHACRVETGFHRARCVGVGRKGRDDHPEIEGSDADAKKAGQTEETKAAEAEQGRTLRRREPRPGGGRLRGAGRGRAHPRRTPPPGSRRSLPRRRLTPRSGRTSSCACMPGGTPIVAARPSSVRPVRLRSS